MAIDVTVSLILRVLLAYIFLRAAVHKARHFQQFVAQLDDYELLPQVLLPGIALLLILAESLLVFTLPIPGWWYPSVLAAALLGIYAVALAINLLRGRYDLDCGCVGPAEFPQGISWALVIRNSVLVLVALVAALPLSQRALSLQDVGTIALASVAALLIYASIGQAIINQQRQKHAAAADGSGRQGKPL